MKINLGFLILLMLSSNSVLALETGFQLEIDNIENKVNLADKKMTDWNQKYKGYKQKMSEIVKQSAQSEYLSDRYYAHFKVIKSQALVLRDLANDFQIIKYQLTLVRHQNDVIKQVLHYYHQPLVDEMVRGGANMIQSGLNFNKNKRREADVFFLLLKRLADVNKRSSYKERQALVMEKKLKQRNKQMLALKRQISVEIEALRESTYIKQQTRKG